MIRVVHVLGRLSASGAERMLECAAPHWSRYGITCAVVGMAEEPHPFATSLEAAGYETHKLPESRSVRGLLALARLLRRVHPDVVHLHAERNFLATFLVARAAGVRRVVRTVHATYPYDESESRRRRRRAAVSARLGLRWTACSEETARFDAERFGTRPAVTENWAAVDGARDAAESRDEVRATLGLNNEVVIGLVGSCQPVKNHALVLAAARGTGVTLLHMGDHSAMPQDERLARERLGTDRLRLLGLRPDVTRVLAACDAVAVPSVREGFSLVAVESLALGLPLLVADAPGLRWLAEHRQVRQLELDEARWRAALLEVRPRREPLTAADETERLRLLERFSPRRGVETYAALYAELAGTRG